MTLDSDLDFSHITWKELFIFNAGYGTQPTGEANPVLLSHIPSPSRTFERSIHVHIFLFLERVSTAQEYIALGKWSLVEVLFYSWKENDQTGH